MKRKFDGIKDLPKLFAILAERPFTWKKVLMIVIPFVILAVCLFVFLTPK